jgi:hypothetical protein
MSGGGDSFHAVSLHRRLHRLCGPTHNVWHTHMFSLDLTHMFSLDVVPTLSGPVCMQLGHSCPCLRQAHTHSIVYIYHWIHDSRVRLRPVQPSDHYRIGTTGFGLPYGSTGSRIRGSQCQARPIHKNAVEPHGPRQVCAVAPRAPRTCPTSDRPSLSSF